MSPLWSLTLQPFWYRLRAEGQSSVSASHWFGATSWGKTRKAGTWVKGSLSGLEAFDSWSELEAAHEQSGWWRLIGDPGDTLKADALDTGWKSEWGLIWERGPVKVGPMASNPNCLTSFPMNYWDVDVFSRPYLSDSLLPPLQHLIYWCRNSRLHLEKDIGLLFLLWEGLTLFCFEGPQLPGNLVGPGEW